MFHILDTCEMHLTIRSATLSNEVACSAERMSLGTRTSAVRKLAWFLNSESVITFIVIFLVGSMLMPLAAAFIAVMSVVPIDFAVTILLIDVQDYPFSSLIGLLCASFILPTVAYVATTIVVVNYFDKRRLSSAFHRGGCDKDVCHCGCPFVNTVLTEKDFDYNMKGSGNVRCPSCECALTRMSKGQATFQHPSACTDDKVGSGIPMSHINDFDLMVSRDLSHRFGKNDCLLSAFESSTGIHVARASLKRDVQSNVETVSVPTSCGTVKADVTPVDDDGFLDDTHLAFLCKKHGVKITMLVVENDKLKVLVFGASTRAGFMYFGGSHYTSLRCKKPSQIIKPVLAAESKDSGDSDFSEADIAEPEEFIQHIEKAPVQSALVPNIQLKFSVLPIGHEDLVFGHVHVSVGDVIARAESHTNTSGNPCKGVISQTQTNRNVLAERSMFECFVDTLGSFLIWSVMVVTLPSVQLGYGAITSWLSEVKEPEVCPTSWADLAGQKTGDEKCIPSNNDVVNGVRLVQEQYKEICDMLNWDYCAIVERPFLVKGPEHGGKDERLPNALRQQMYYKDRDLQLIDVQIRQYDSLLHWFFKMTVALFCFSLKISAIPSMCYRLFSFDIGVVAIIGALLFWDARKKELINIAKIWRGTIKGKHLFYCPTLVAMIFNEIDRDQPIELQEKFASQKLTVYAGMLNIPSSMWTMQDGCLQVLKYLIKLRSTGEIFSLNR